MKMKAISIKIMIAGLVIFWFTTSILPKSLIIPITAAVGLVALLTGIIKIHEMTHLVQSFPNVVNIKRTLLNKGIIAVIVACISLALWVPLFTFRFWLLWKGINYGNVILWAINTGVYSYLLFLETTINLVKNVPINREDNETV